MFKHGQDTWATGYIGAAYFGYLLSPFGVAFTFVPIFKINVDWS